MGAKEKVGIKPRLVTKEESVMSWPEKVAVMGDECQSTWPPFWSCSLRKAWFIHAFISFREWAWRNKKMGNSLVLCKVEYIRFCTYYFHFQWLNKTSFLLWWSVRRWAISILSKNACPLVPCCFLPSVILDLLLHCNKDSCPNPLPDRLPNKQDWIIMPLIWNPYQVADAPQICLGWELMGLDLGHEVRVGLVSVNRGTNSSRTKKRSVMPWATWREKCWFFVLGSCFMLGENGLLRIQIKTSDTLKQAVIENLNLHFVSSSRLHLEKERPVEN